MRLPLPGRDAAPLRWELAPLRGVLTFSLSIAFTSSAWVLITQTDKLVLSRMLPLTEYGYYTLAVLVAGGVLPEITWKQGVEVFGQDGAAELVYLVGLYCLVSVTLNGFDVPIPE